MARDSTGSDRRIARVADKVAANSRAVLGALLVVTAGLAYPMLFWTPNETASQSPATEVTTTQELIAERFADDVFDFLLLVEADGGDILEKPALLALFENSEALRRDPGLNEYLVTFHHPDLGVDVDGIWTLADSVDRLLRGLGSASGLAGASQDQIDGAVGAILEASAPIDWGLAIQTTQDADGVWHSPALFASVAADNEKLGGGGFLVTIGTDSLDKEYFARDLVAALGGDGTELNVWAPAADVNLTSNEQGELAGPFIGITIALVLLIVGISFRSYWAVAISGAGLGILMVWLRGGANLAGLKSDQILSIILPISIISFGIDSAFHSIGRMREKQREGVHGSRAFVLAISSVVAALALAATSDAVAFLSNTASGIESIIQFGFGAAISTVAAFILLGIATPLLLSVIETRTEEKTVTGFGVMGDMVLSVFAAGLATATVLVLVFISAEVGLALLGAYLLLALALPYRLALRHRGSDAFLAGKGSGARRLGAAVAAVASRPALTTLVATAITAASVWAALHLEVTFDVNDFFSRDSDFVVALDKTNEYIGDQGGEPALVYIESDLTQPIAVEGMRNFLATIQNTPDNPLAVDTTGTIRVDRGVLELLDFAPVAVDSPEVISALYDRSLAQGVVGPAGNLLYTPNDIGTMLWKSDDGNRYATVLAYRVPDTRNQENVTRTRAVLEPAAQQLEAALRQTDPDATVVVTGSAIYRDDQLAGIRRALLLALPIAVVACFVVSAMFMRSIRYALVSIIPILLVVTWLYGIMYVAGYSINVVTSIIGAVSVGIGIDFSTHLTMRFLEERERGLKKMPALSGAGAGTGTALFGSALTSVAGFGALAFAPMPMFASYGLLTAVMIVLALVASLFVLPSLLALVTRSDSRDRMQHRSVDLRTNTGPMRIGLARDVSEAVLRDVASAFAERLRRGRLSVDTHPGPMVGGLVADGAIDIGLVVRWPGGGRLETNDVDSLVLIREEIVVVGNAERSGTEPIPVSDLGRCLLVAGPHAESEEGARQLLRTEMPYPVLAHTVPDVITGLRIAGITGGAMLLPRSMAPSGGALPVRSLLPKQWMETLLLVSPERSADPDVFDVVMQLSMTIEADDQIDLEESVRLNVG